MRPQNKHKASQAVATSRDGRTSSEKSGKPQQRPKQQHASFTSDVVHDRTPHTLPLDLRQAILNVFNQAFPLITQVPEFRKVMQEVKGHLYNREFTSAFGKQEYLEVYALRWSAARALVYADIFTDPKRRMWLQAPASTVHDRTITDQSKQIQDPVIESITSGIPDPIGTFLETRQSGSSSGPPSQQADFQCKSSLELGVQAESAVGQRTKVVCIGGGAGAEIVALAATSRYLHSTHNHTDAQGTGLPIPQFDILAIDVADWSNPVERLSAALASQPELSKRASQSVHDANCALLNPSEHGSVQVAFKQQDVLEIVPDALRQTVCNVTLVTIMFTLNELFSESLARTTGLLLNLTNFMMIGAHLVVVDSPGSYSEIKLGKSKPSDGPQGLKRYPMKWLLDHTLLEVAGEGNAVRWAKTEDEDSQWFRMHDKQELKYGVDLENCRYQLHAYRKIR